MLEYSSARGGCRLSVRPADVEAQRVPLARADHRRGLRIGRMGEGAALVGRVAHHSRQHVTAQRSGRRGWGDAVDGSRAVRLDRAMRRCWSGCSRSIRNRRSGGRRWAPRACRRHARPGAGRGDVAQWVRERPPLSGGAPGDPDPAARAFSTGGGARRSTHGLRTSRPSSRRAPGPRIRDCCRVSLADRQVGSLARQERRRRPWWGREHGNSRLRARNTAGLALPQGSQMPVSKPRRRQHTGRLDLDASWSSCGWHLVTVEF
jgi:hypothetical protein